MNKYSGQALAIVLVLLIVGSIIGFALYARMIRESERVVDEKASSEANELVETTIGFMSTLGYDQIKNENVLWQINECTDVNLQSNDGCRTNNLTLQEVEDLLQEMGIENPDLSDFERDINYCVMELALYSSASLGITIDKDYSYPIFFNNAENLENCEITFTMEKLEEGTNSFVMSTFYAHRNESGELLNYKPYQFEDIVGFKYGEEGGNNWEEYTTGTDLTFSSSGTYPIKKDLESTLYAIDEIRFKSLGGKSKLIWNANSDCELEDPLWIEVGATCGGNYVGKSFIMPEESFAPPMFDYVYFQGKGGLN